MTAKSDLEVQDLWRWCRALEGKLNGFLARRGRPLMILGDISQLHMRVEVDEYDAWRVRPGDRRLASRKRIY